MRAFRYLLTLAMLNLTVTASARAQTPDADSRSSCHLTVSLGELVSSTENSTVLVVDKNDPMQEEVIFKKVAELRGGSETRQLRECITIRLHRISARSKRDFQAWAEPGKQAILIHNGFGGILCVDNCWFATQYVEDEIWFLDARASSSYPIYVGSVQKLRKQVVDILAGNELVITASVLPLESASCFWDSGSPLLRDWLHGKKGRVCRIKAGLRIGTFQETRLECASEFVGWGVGCSEIVPALVKNLRHADSMVRAEAAADLGTLGATGKAALGALRDRFDDPDGYVRVYAAEAVVLIDAAAPDALDSLVKMLDDRRDGPRGAAATALASLEPPPRCAAPALTRCLREDSDEYVRRVAAFALGRMGVDIDHGVFQAPEAVAALAEALRSDPDEGVRFWSAHTLRRFGPDARRAIPALGAALTDESQQVAEVSAAALERFGPEVVPLFADALASGRCRADDVIIDYLREMGPVAKQAAPALCFALAGPWTARQKAALALRVIDRDTAVREVIPALVNVMDQSGGEVISTIAEFGSDARAALPALMKCFQDEKNSRRRAAINAIAEIGIGGSDVETLLRGLLQEKEASVRMAAWSALGRIGCSSEAVAGLVDEIKRATGNDLPVALRALESLGGEARTAVPALRQALRKQGAAHRADIALTIWRVERREEFGGVAFDPRQDAVVELIKILSNKRDADAWDNAIWALRHLGPDARDAVPTLIGVLRGPRLRASAAEILGAIGPSASTAIPALRAALSEPDLDFRLSAALALCRIKGGDDAAQAELIRILEREPMQLQETGMQDVLIQLGPEVKPATPTLLRLLRHDDNNLYHAAARVLKAVNPEAAATAGLP
jgi:HEAT repeat protein